jgi:hypothetical protein
MFDGKCQSTAAIYDGVGSTLLLLLLCSGLLTSHELTVHALHAQLVPAACKHNTCLRLLQRQQQQQQGKCAHTATVEQLLLWMGKSLASLRTQWSTTDQLVHSTCRRTDL